MLVPWPAPLIASNIYGNISLFMALQQLHVADATPHHLTGIGFLKVQIVGSPGFLFVHTFYTPSLPATILSPASITSNHGCVGFSSFAKLDGQQCCLTLHGHSPSIDVMFPLQIHHGLLFTHALIHPSPDSVPSTLMQCIYSEPILPVPLLHEFPVQHLSKQQLSHLWHQHFGHLGCSLVSEMFCFATGVPHISVPHDLDSCPVCLSSKLHHSP